jgi:outer membrane protein
MLRFVATVMLGVVPCAAIAQTDVLSLDQALEIALRQNVMIANAELEAQAAGDEVAALRTRRLPRFDVMGRTSQNLQDQEYTFDQGVWGTYPVIGAVPPRDVTIESATGATSLVSFGVTQPLAQQYRIGLSIEQGEVKEQMAAENVRLTQQDMARVVKQEYFDIVQTQSDLETTLESIRFYVSLNELVAHYVEQEVALEYQLLEVQARLARRQLQATDQRNRLATHRERMNDLLGRDLNTPFEVQTLPDPATSERDPSAAIAAALSQRPDVLESKLQVEDAQLGYDIKRAEYIPDVDVSLRYARLYGYEFVPDVEAYVGLHLRWELYDWGRKRDELAAKSGMIEKANNHVMAVRNGAIIDVRSSLRALQQAQRAVEVATLSQNATRDKLRVLMNQYRQQSALLQDVLEAETDNDRANNDYSRAVLAVWKAQAEFERAIGTL